MKPTELRLGNLLHDREGKLCRVKQLSFDADEFHAPVIEGALTGLPHKPIPITEEWLLKFGFYKWETDEGVYDDYFKHDKLFPQLAAFYLPYFHMNLYVGGITVQHVHQLQNLFFAITGQELKLKNEI